MISGDVESNPGPTSATSVCRKCELKITVRHKPIQCRKCLGWFHSTSCTSTKRGTIDDTLDNNATWTCIVCDEEECDCGRLPGSKRKCRGNGDCRKVARPSEEEKRSSRVKEGVRDGSNPADEGVDRGKGTGSEERPEREGEYRGRKRQTRERAMERRRSGETNAGSQETPECDCGRLRADNGRCRGRGGCRRYVAGTTESSRTMEGDGGECCAKCKNSIKTGEDTMICKQCKKRYHFSFGCSNVRKTRGKNLQRDAWRCVGCSERQETPEEERNQVEEEDQQRQETSGEGTQIQEEEQQRQETATEETTQAQEGYQQTEVPETEIDQAPQEEQLVDVQDSSTTISNAGGGRRKCKLCTGIIRNYNSMTGLDYITCSKCRGNFHKKAGCSDIKPGQLKDLDLTQWWCTGCLQIAEEQAAPRDDQSADIEYVIRDNSQKRNCKGDLKIMQWNAGGITQPKLVEFRALVDNIKPDVFAIQETKLVSTDTTPKIPGYTVKRKDRWQAKGNERNRGGGLLMGISKERWFKEVKRDLRGPEDDITESQTFELPIAGKGKGKVRITNIYIPPIRNTASERRRERRSEVTLDRWPSGVDDIIVGDINAHSVLWDKTLEEKERNDEGTKRGGLVEEWMADKDMMTANDRNPTLNSTSGTSSAPDLSIVHTSKLDKFSWKTLDELGSDHKPILVTYEPGVPIKNNHIIPKYKWKLKDAKWEEFQAEIEEKMPDPNRNRKKKSLHKLEKFFRKTIMQAAKSKIGKKKIDNNTKPHLTTEIKEKIKERNRLRKNFKENRARWVQMCTEVKDLIRAEKEKKWRNFIEEIDCNTRVKEVWRTIRNIDGRNPPRNENEVLVVDGKGYVEDKDKADQFRKTYKGFSKIPRFKEDRRLQKGVYKFLSNSKGLRRESEEQEIREEEMYRVIEEAKMGKSPGEDDIAYELIKQLGVKARAFLLDMYRRIWQGEEIPQQWRKANIITLLKEGKDPEATESYRPISLTSCLGKLLEKIVADRLSHIMETRGSFNNNQAGFRRNRCTGDQALKLVQAATDEMHAKKGNFSIVTFFDFSKAYDKVWRVGLMHKMIQKGIPYRFINYVRHFLSSRQTTVDVNGAKSKRFYLKEGLPQGSAISPLLFLIFIDDIDEELSSHTDRSLYADDTAAWTTKGRSKAEAEKRMQESINRIAAWSRKWKMTLNESKTEALVISAGSGQHWAPSLKLNSKPIKIVDEYKFLGVVIDKNLRFKKHADKTRKKAKKRVNILKCMSGKSWGQSLETQRKLYLTYVRSTIEYASPAWYNMLSETEKLKLEVIQNEALRSIGGLGKTCPVDFLRLETEVEPLKSRMKKNDQITAERYKRLEAGDGRRIMMEKVARTRLDTRPGWRKSTMETMQEYEVNREIRVDIIPPWYATKANFDAVELKKKKEEYTSGELKNLTLTKIFEMDADVEIYTDGSTGEGQLNGGAGVHATDKTGTVLYETSLPAGKWCPSYDGEAVAMLEATRWVARYTDPATHCLILTDSKSLVDALKRDSWRDNHEWLSKIKTNIANITCKLTIMWIPAHCDTAGNERADFLAKEGSKLEQSATPVTFNIVKAKILGKKWEIKHQRAKEMYGDRRGPKRIIEKVWPRNVRSMFSRLRTDHCRQLQNFQCNTLHKAETALCPRCGGEDDTIGHILCRCPTLEEKRQQIRIGEWKMGDMVKKPLECMELLRTCFPEELEVAAHAETGASYNAQ
jgi:ribonuclease HI/exonuclease III